MRKVDAVIIIWKYLPYGYETDNTISQFCNVCLSIIYQ